MTYNELKKIVNFDNFKKAAKQYKNSKPFPYLICKNFLNNNFAKKILNEFPNYSKKNFWHEYNNFIEVKKTCNDWNKFGKNTYRLFSLLNSPKFILSISKYLKIKNLFPDSGLNGGGLHIHKNGGKLNFHLDYSMHPKINFQRKINLLIYITPNWKKSYGGELGFWSHDPKKFAPHRLEKKIVPNFNTAVFFDTTKNSWHGLVNPIKTKKGIFRKSLAVYYLIEKNTRDLRSKALFAPTNKQKKNKKILKLIKMRSSSSFAKKVYVK